MVLTMNAEMESTVCSLHVGATSYLNAALCGWNSKEPSGLMFTVLI
jgi:hypothetical protein